LQLHTKGELIKERGEITRRKFFEEGNLRRGTFGGESAQREIFEERNFCEGESSRSGMFGGEFSVRSIFAELTRQRIAYLLNV
jgi:hypothetical protein